MTAARLACALLVAAACTPAPGVEPIEGEPPVGDGCEHTGGDADFATCVADFEPSAPASYGHDALPGVVLGPPMPGNSGSGSTDVASLGCDGTITLGFAEPLVDRDGADFVVFENPFVAGDITFVEPARVLVSDDGKTWFAFECAAADHETTGCAGATPTAADAATTPTDRGGDEFDLDELGLARARWIRLVDVTRDYYGDDQWCAGAGGGFDLDAIARIAP